jgi:iron complex outermembrane receptor protein
VLLCAASVLTPFSFAHAQTATVAASPPQSAAAAISSEVVVTARKRTERVQDVPIAISAFSGASLAARGVDKIDGVANITPNMTFQNNPSFGGAGSSAAIYIRGIGQKEFLPTVEPGVGVYVDGVYVASSVGAVLDLVDIDRVEVLRGPQGTLFGRNTIGGAINVTTQKPNDVLSSTGELTTGSYNRVDLKFIENIPLTSTLYAKLSYASFERSGYVPMVYEDKKLGNINTHTARLDLRWVPTSNFEVNLSIEGTRDHNNGPPITLSGINLTSQVFNPKNLPVLPPGSAPKPGYYVANPPFDAPTDNFALLNNYEAFFLGGQPCLSLNPYNAAGAKSPACYNSQYISNKVNYGTAPTYSDNDMWDASATIDWNLGPVQLKSITAYRDLSGTFARDGDDSPLTVSQFYDSLRQQQFSQEFQLLGATPDKTLKYVAGLYYFYQQGDDINLLQFVPADFQSGGDFGTKSYAAFGQATWTFWPKFDLTGGLRYTQDNKTFFPDQFITADLTPGQQLIAGSPNTPKTLILPHVQSSLSEGDLTPMLNLSWHATRDLMAYASYSQGFKSGGFDQRVFPPLAATPQYQSEKATTYELGIKSQFLDRRLTVNADIFDTEYSNLQVQVFTGVAPVTENAAAARIEGAELESKYAVGAGWFLEGSVGYLDPKYTKINSDANEITLNSKFERISTWTLNGSLSKSVEFGDGSELSARADASYRTGFYMDALNSPELYQKAYALLNASVSYTFLQKKLTITLGGTNITSTHYSETGIYDTSFGSYENLFARPGEWYLRLKYKL